MLTTATPLHYLMVLATCVSVQVASRAAPVFEGKALSISEFLILPQVGQYGRVPIHVDPIQSRLTRGSWKPPSAGDELMAVGGKVVSWSTVTADKDGWIEASALKGGYAYAQVDSPERQIVVLEASGHAMVFVNGEPRAGDPYLTGRTVLPLVLKQGTNEFLFHAAAGKLRAQLWKPAEEVQFDSRDMTLPTLVRGESEPVWLGVLLINSRDRALTDVQATTSASSRESLTAKVDSVPPLGVRKIAIPLSPPKWDAIAKDLTQAEVKVSLKSAGDTATLDLRLKVVDADKLQTRTFRSDIDGSVQEYCLLPAQESASEKKAGLLVTLHDSGESAVTHIASITAQEGVHVLAPSGRRSEGCDWEDWSGLNVLESVDDAAQRVKFDARRVWLRGTGAGGHGVLRLGAVAADRWAALVPRDPWLEYSSNPQSSVAMPIGEMLERVVDSNRLTPLMRNTAAAAVRLEDSSSNPATQELGRLLKAFHPRLETAQVRVNTLAPTLEFCEAQTKRDIAKVTEVDCVTYNPGTNATIHWLTILSQQEMASLSRAAVQFHPEQKVFEGLTANVAALEIDVAHLEADTMVAVMLDGQPVGEFAVEDEPLTFLQNESGWQLVPSLPPLFKQPHRYGGLRSAFGNDPILVYGTRGTPEERSWALAKARYDAETVLVRRNGSVDVIPDTAFKMSEKPDRNVVLYGNASTNLAWPQQMSMSPVQLRGDGVWIERRPELGEGLACVFVRPRRGSDKAVVGVVGGNDIAGMRATDRIPFFVNGAMFPDLLLFGARSLTEGSADVRAAGFFGRVWTVDPGEIVWRDPAL